MDPLLIRAFQEQVAQQARFVLRGTKDARDALNRLHDLSEQVPANLDAKRDAMDLFWYSTQAVVTDAGNIAKVLWGAGGKRAQSRLPLRESLAVDEASPLKALRMRNHFEHLDERLEVWWAKSERHDYRDRNIGDAQHPDFADIDTFRNYDPELAELVFWGDRINLSALVSEVRRILSRVERELGRGHPPR